MDDRYYQEQRDLRSEVRAQAVTINDLALRVRALEVDNANSKARAATWPGWAISIVGILVSSGITLLATYIARLP